jgi:SAM-dependent methyltransferase
VALIEAGASLRYTYEFVTANLPPGARRILEVGCGDGSLAALIQEDGLEVVAIDSDPGAVESAKAAGVDARLMAWPEPIGTEFDAILFTRSLHHIPALDEAVAAAGRALGPKGRVIVEDFRSEGGSEKSNGWFTELARSLVADNAVDANLGQLLDKLAPADHDLHSSGVIAEALDGFDVVAGDAAYYFRYLEPHLRRPGMAQALLDEELARIDSGAIDPLGKRFVAAPR